MFQVRVDLHTDRQTRNRQQEKLSPLMESDESCEAQLTEWLTILRARYCPADDRGISTSGCRYCLRQI